jgi:hypothetical protein
MQLATLALGWRLSNRWRWDSSVRFITDSDNGNRFEAQGFPRCCACRWANASRYIRNSGLFSEDRASNFSRVFFQPRHALPDNAELGGRPPRRLALDRAVLPFFANVGFGVHF